MSSNIVLAASVSGVASVWKTDSLKLCGMHTTLASLNFLGIYTTIALSLEKKQLILKFKLVIFQKL